MKKAIGIYLVVLFFLNLSILYSEERKRGGQELPSIIVFDIKPEKEVDIGSANLLTEIVLDKVTDLLKGKYKVLGQKDIDKMLFWETNKSLKNCAESSCLMQIAGALGADYYIEGSVGVMGKKFILTLKFIDAYKVEVVRRRTEVMEKEEENLISKTDKVVKEILGISETDKLSETGQMSSEGKVSISKTDTNIKSEYSEKSNMNETSAQNNLVSKAIIDKGEGKDLYGIVGYSLIGFGVLGMGVGVYYNLEANSIANNENMTREEATDAGEDYKSNMIKSGIFYTVGGMCIVGGIVSLIYGSKSKKDSEKIGLYFGVNRIEVGYSF